MADKKLEVILTGDSKRLEAALNRGEKKVHHFGAVGAAAGLLIAGGLAVAIKDVVGDFLDGEKGAAQTAAVLKSTGGVANVTAKQVDDLASSIRNKTGIDDDAVTSGENMLLTFSNVRNEVGAGNDIFTRATKAAADMSVALGKDMPSASMMLGKALNDPVAGMMKLGRAGVQFTQAQKDQVAAMVAAGDTAGAQKVILAELSKEFGGSAEAAGKTLGGQLSILKGRFEDVGGVVVAKVIPVLLQVLNWVSAHWPQISAVFSAVFAVVDQVFSSAVAFIRGHWTQIEAAAQQVIVWYQVNVAPAISAVATAVQAVLAGLAAFWARWGGQIIGIVTTALGVVKSVIETVLAVIHGDWSKAWEGIKSIVRGALSLIVQVLSLAVSTLGALALAIGQAVLDKIKQGVGNLKGAIADKIGDLKDGLVSAVKNVAGDARNVGAAVLQGIKDGIGDIGGWIEGKVKSAINGLIRIFNSALSSGVGRMNSALAFHATVDTHIPGVGKVGFGWDGPGLTAPQIPQLASGGIVRARPGGTLILAGEGGQDELVTPLRHGSFGGGGVTIIFQQTPANADAQAIAAAVAWRMRAVSV